MTAPCGCGCGCGSVVPGTCGCCEGVHPATPRAVVNRPYLDALSYRVGTHGSFLATMLARLSGPDFPKLHELAARTGDDAAIALLDAWATVADVLTFYQERIANEGYLRTATERRSIVEAARLVGYALRPGVAASVYLAYTVDKDPQGNETVVTIPKGSRAQSIPGSGELPQPFETSLDVVASSAWTNLKPRLWRPLRLLSTQAAELEELYLDGISPGLRPGDVVLLVFGSRGEVRVPLTVKKVTPEQIVPDPPGPPLLRTVVTFQQPERPPLLAALDALDTALQVARDLEGAGLLESDLANETDTDVLEPLETVVEGRPSAHRLAGAVEDALAKLRERRAVAEEKGEADVAAWLERSVQDLEQPLERLREHARSSAAAAQAAAAVERVAPAPAGVPAGGAAVAGIGGLLDALRLRPAVQPAGSLALERSSKQLFGSGSDLGPRLLVAFDPSLSESLYRTWERETVPATTALQSAEAMRVKAAPFGATAALRPVLDAKGAVVGSEEWPLGDAIRLGVRATYNDNVATHVELSATVHDETSKGERSAPNLSGTIPLPPGRATVKGRTELVVAFKSQLPPLTVTIKPSSAGFTVHLKGDRPRTVQPGEVLRHTKGRQRITIALADDPQTHGQVLTVTDEILQPPRPRDVLALDAEYGQVVPGSWVVIDWGTSARPTIVRRVAAVKTVAKTAYNLSAKVTELKLSSTWLDETDLLLSAIRGVTVYVQSEPLDLAPAPVEDDVGGSSIELGELYRGLESGRWVIVEGERTDIPRTTGVRAAELAMLAGVTQAADRSLPGDRPHTTLLLARPLAYTYKRSTVKVWGNVAEATHGESRPELPGTADREEVLGAGDATKAFQEFPLRSSPLTYLAAANPLGAESTLEVRVDQVLWHEVDSLALAGPTDRCYVTRTDDDDKTTVIFGDGQRGARLTTGIENVRAAYRTKVGRGGNVKAGQITALQTRPLGVSGVVNPLPATGGADRDTLEQARRNTPLAVKALDRLVSVQDYEDFARARAGIGKAGARALSDGTRTVVHLTIAGAGDVPVDRSSDLYRALRAALAQWGDPAQPVEVAVRELVLLVISAGVEVDPDYRFSDVEPKVRAALLDRFGFDRRELGQSVYLSEVQSVAQKVRGVVSVDVDVLAGVPETITPAALARLGRRLKPPPKRRIHAELARFERRTYVAKRNETLTGIAAAHGVPLAELLRLNPTLPVSELGQLEGVELVLFSGIRPAQLVLLSPSIPDTLILREVTR
jgi:predicted phage baseplate assembly protein